MSHADAFHFQPLSILCRSFEDIDTYTTGFPRGNGQGLTNIFRAVKHCLPGPVSLTGYAITVSMLNLMACLFLTN